MKTGMHYLLLVALLALPAGSAVAQADLGTPLAPTGSILYAAPTAQGSGDCSSWADACTLQTALTNALSGDEIWVQAGVHKPGAEREDTFVLADGVALYSGFAGTETQRDQRDWQANLTVLSGDIGGDDVADPSGVVTITANIVGDNNYHVLYGYGLTANAVLDGFVVTAGQATGGFDDYGGGMFNYDEASPTLSDVTFSGNSAADGGGMYNSYAS